VIITQGAADTLINPSFTAAFVKRLCMTGERLSYRVYPGVDHVHTGAVTAADIAAWIAAWIADRFAGKRAPPACARA
jgi:hypothetical protein